MRDCDVLVVGGGPAGSSLAWALRERGLDVVLVDRSAFPRDKVCAGWVTPPVVDALGLDLDDYAAGGRTLQPLHGFRIGLLGGTPLTTRRARRPLSYGIRRCEFDHYLLERAPAEKHLGAACRAFSRDGARWQVDGTWRCRLLVGAGGHFCPVARQLSGSKEPAASVVSAQEIEFHLAPGEAAASPVEPTVPELYFTPDLAGYGWVFRKGDWLNVGLGCLGGGQLSTRARGFRDWLLRQGRIPASTPERWHGHAYLLYPTAPRPLLDDGVLLVGDAAGLAHPQSGEGIRPAVESALLAAEAIAAAAGDYRARNLGAYPVRLEQRFGRRRHAAPVSAAGPLKRFVAGRILGNRMLAQHLVVERWFLQRHQVPLAPA